MEFLAWLNRDMIRATPGPRRQPLAVVGVPHHPAREAT
jgi:hypothetical protein